LTTAVNRSPELATVGYQTKETSMLTVTKAQLFQFLESGEEFDNFTEFREQVEDYDNAVALDEATFTALKACDLKKVLIGQEMSTNHLGGDDLVSMADDVVAAVAAGYAITTWYGPSSEAMVAGYRSTELNPVDSPTGDSADMCSLH
jgi:hypothetical protein